METVTLLILGLALGIIGVIYLIRLVTSSAQNKPFMVREKRESDGYESTDSLNEFPLTMVDKNRHSNSKLVSHQSDFEVGGDFGLNDLDYLLNNPHNENPQIMAINKLAEPQVPKPLIHQQSIQHQSELPEGYGDNLITLLVRDPEWIFAYWEINQSKIQEIRQNFGSWAWEEGQHVLRVYDTTDLIFNGYNANHQFDIQISLFSKQWHVQVGQPNRTYCIDRGIIIHNQYVVLARSNYVTTPSNCVSNLIDEQWMLLNEYDRKLYRHLEQLAFGVSSPQFAYSISLAEELANLGLGVSSPLNPRPTQIVDAEYPPVTSLIESRIQSEIIKLV